MCRETAADVRICLLFFFILFLYIPIQASTGEEPQLFRLSDFSGSLNLLCQIIDEEEAIQIAHNAGLEEGIKEWKTSFNYYAGDIDDYIWAISNTLYENDYHSGGKTVIINSHSGEVIEILSWIGVS